MPIPAIIVYALIIIGSGTVGKWIGRAIVKTFLAQPELNINRKE